MGDRRQLQASTGDTHERQGQLLLDLRDKVSEVYKACGFDAAGGSPETLFMLSELEAKLEDLLTAIEQMPEVSTTIHGRKHGPTIVLTGDA